MVSIVLGFVPNVLPVLQFVFHFFPRYEQKFVGGAVKKKPYFKFFPENDVYEFCLISAELCSI